MQKVFTKFAKGASHWTGQPIAFLLAAGVILVWILTGPIFGFSDTWQLVINTGTTIVTFLMVFLIQNTQNRDTKALQLKLDELIFVMAKANNSLLDLEELEEGELDKIWDRYEKMAALARKAGMTYDSTITGDTDHVKRP
ncbi:MAG: low affinity iron permease family protein [Chloroflexota bacterium]|nr:low affinity iron permease family protein [Chloroflexota bacterium]